MSDRVVVVFPGQGSQAVGMGADLTDAFPEVATYFAAARDIVGYDLAAIMRNGPDGELRETRVSQPAIFLTNFALAAAVGPALAPIGAGGHSFGEFCALAIAGSMTFDAALRLVHERALAMGRAADRNPGAMSAVLGLDADRLRDVVDEVRAEPGARVRMANFNAPTQIVISGDRRSVERTGTLAVAAGAKRVVPLNVSGAWHSELMESAQREFATVIAAADIRLPQFPIISNVDAQAYTSVEGVRENLIRSVTDEVRWHETALALLRLSPTLVVEFGASPVLSPLMKRLPDVPDVMHVGDAKGVQKLRDRLAA